MSGWDAFVGSVQGNSLALPAQGFEDSSLYGNERDPAEVSSNRCSELSAIDQYSRGRVWPEIELTSTCSRFRTNLPSSRLDWSSSRSPHDYIRCRALRMCYSSL